MKAKLFIWFLFLVPLFMKGQNSDDYFMFRNDSIKILPKNYKFDSFSNSNGFRWQLDSLPDGKYVEITDSTKFDIFSIDDMHLNGPFEFFTNGELSETGYYQKGIRTGVWKNYNNGKLAAVYYYNDNVHSEYEFYYENGNIKRRCISIEEKGNCTISLNTEWYPNGNKKEQGLEKSCSKHHSFVKDYKFKTWTYWHENGEVKTSGKYRKNKEVGVWDVRDSTGNYIATMKFRNGSIKRMTKYTFEKRGEIDIYVIENFKSDQKLKKKTIQYLNEGYVILETYNSKGKITKTERIKLSY